MFWIVWDVVYCRDLCVLVLTELTGRRHVQQLEMSMHVPQLAFRFVNVTVTCFLFGFI